MARFGMPGGRGFGFLRKNAERYVDSGSRRANKFANKIEGRMPKGGRTLGPKDRYSEDFGKAHREATIKARQRVVGRRYAVGGGLAAGSTMMLPNSNQTRGGYKGPTAKGTGRYA